MISALVKAFAGVSLPHLAAAAGAIALIAGAAGFGGGWTINGWRLSGQVEKAMGEVSVCQSDLRGLGRSVETQNNATRAAKAAADERRAQGDIAQKAADATVVRLQPELDRLAEKIANKAAGSAAKSCAEGVLEVRKGLKP